MSKEQPIELEQVVVDRPLPPNRALPPTPHYSNSNSEDGDIETLPKPKSAQTPSKMLLWAGVGVGGVLVVAVVILVAVMVASSNDNDKINPVPTAGPEPSFRAAAIDADGVVENPAQLAKELIPLKLLTALPAEATQLAQRQALTFVFSKSVIALGSNFDANEDITAASVVCNGKTSQVPGKWRWVTTFILRFDPDINWPNDLTCTVTLSALTSWDGSVLQNVPPPKIYTTHRLSMYINSVTSKKAMELTNGGWMSQIDGDVVKYEAPPDAKICVSFSDPVSVTAVKNLFTLTGPSSSKKFVVSGPCEGMKGDEVTCVCGSVSEGGLVTGTNTLLIPPQSRVTDVSGPLTAATSVDLEGLQPFQFRFSRYLEHNVGAKRLQLWLRHGLDNSTNVDHMLQYISVSPASGTPSIKRVNAFTLELYVPWLSASQSYTISVQSAAEIKDGYGQSLIASSATFSTQESTKEVFDLTNGDVVYPSRLGEKWVEWDIFARRGTSQNTCGDPYLAFDVIGYSEPTADFLKYIAGIEDYRFAPAWQSSKQTYQLPATSGLVFEALSNVQVVKSLLNTTSSGLLLRQCGSSCGSSYSIISRSTRLISAMANREALSIWITDYESVAPVPNADVKVYLMASLKTLTGKTNSDGFVSIPYPADDDESYWRDSAIIVCQTGSGTPISVLRNFYMQRTSGIQHHIAAFTDRGVYSIGDTVNIRGYVREMSKEGTTMKLLPRGTIVTCIIRWGEGVEPTNKQLALDEFGGFTAAVVVPSDAEYKTQIISLSTSIGYSSATFVVSDPKIPTATLNLDSDEKVLLLKNRNAFGFTVKTETYSGEPLINSKVELTWKFTHLNPQGTTNGTNGTVTAVTGSDGKGKWSLSLPSGEYVVDDGDLISITAQWLSPTRDLLTKQLAMTVRAALVNIQANRVQARARAIPTVPFYYTVAVDATNDVSTESAKTVTIEGFSATRSIAGQVSVDTTQVSAFVTSCPLLLINGSAAKFEGDCAVTLPAMGLFFVRFSVSDSQGNVAYSGMYVGETKEDWDTFPLSTPVPIVVTLSGSSVVPANGDVPLAFSNRYNFTARALIACSLSGTATTVVPPGKSYFSVSFSTCKGKQLNVAIISPVDTSSTITSLPVPISSTESFSIPRVWVSQLAVPRASGFLSPTLAISVPSQIVAPASTLEATISVQLAGQATLASGTVTVMAVAKSILDLQPRSEVSNISFDNTQGANWVISRDLREQILGAETMQTMKSFVPDVSSISPFLSSYMINHARHRNVKQYTESLYSEITPFPPRYVPFEYWNYYGGEERAYAAELNAAGGQPPPQVAKDTSSEQQSSTTVTPSVHVRSDFQPTTFYQASVPLVNGQASVRIPLNDRVGTWVLTAVVATANEGTTLAAKSTEVIARKQVQLLSSMPRVVRVGDEFKGGVVVSAVAKTTVVVKLDKLCKGLTAEKNEQAVNVEPGSPVEVLFFFKAESWDPTCQTRWSVTGDSIEIETNVLGTLPPTTLGTSFSLRNDAVWNEGLTYPRFIPGSGEILIVGSAGRLSVIEGWLTEVLDRYDNARDVYSPMLLDIVEGFVALQVYTGQPFTDAGLKAVEGKLMGRARDKFIVALELLQKYTDANGLRFQVKVPYYPSTDPYLNARALRVVQKLLPGSSALSDLYTKAKLSDMVSAWDTALKAEIRRISAMNQRYNSGPSSYLSAYMFYCLGATTFVPTADMFFAVVNLAQLVQTRNQLGITTQSYLLAALVEANTESTVTAEMSRILYDSIRITGRTAYVAESASGRSPSLDVSARLLKSFTTLGPQTTTIPDLVLEKFANFMSEGSINRPSWYSYAESKTEAMLALSKYDVIRRVTDPNIQLTVFNTSSSTSNAVLFSTSFVGTESLRNTQEFGTTFEMLSKKVYDADTHRQDINATLEFHTAGTGEVSMGLTMTFVPQTPIVNAPRFYGLFVQKNVQDIDAAYKGPAVPGRVMKITITVTTADDVPSLIITDYTCGGMEPIDANLAGNAATLAVAEAEPTQPTQSSKVSYMMPWWYWFFPTFSVQVMRDRVVCTGLFMYAGTYECVYYATLTTTGFFIIPPAEAHLFRQPEVMGLSMYSNISIAARG